MASDMKAVITLTADASGVAIGVQKAMKSLEALQDTVRDLRGLAVAGILSNVLKGFADGAMAELKRLEGLGRSYSPEGNRAANQLAVAEQQSDRTLGQAFGPFTAAIDQMKVQAIKDLTDYLVANKEPIGQAMAALAGFVVGLSDMTAQTLVVFGKFVDWISNNTPGKIASDVAVNVGGQSILGPTSQTSIIGMNLVIDILRQKLGGT